MLICERLRPWVPGSSSRHTPHAVISDLYVASSELGPCLLGRLAGPLMRFRHREACFGPLEVFAQVIRARLFVQANILKKDTQRHVPLFA